MSDNTQDQRTDVRAAIELKVEYARVNKFISDYTRNISQGGTFIKTSRPLPVGTEFLFHLTVPSLAAPLSLRGVVRWVVSAEEAETDPEKEAGMGIKYVYQDAEEETRVRATVRQILVEQLGDRAYEALLGGSGA